MEQKVRVMKNLSLFTKIGILVFVLAASSGTIAVVGLRQLATVHEQLKSLVDRTSEAIMLAGATRVDLLRSLRAEKNAVLATSQSEAREWADRARESTEQRKRHSAELAGLVDESLGTAEGKAIDNFNRGAEEFDPNQREVLRLAVIKSLAEGKLILNQELGALAHDLEDFVTGLNTGATGDSTSASQEGRSLGYAPKYAAGRELTGRLYDILYHLTLHLDAVKDEEMTQLDAEIRERTVTFQDNLRRLSTLLTDEERTRASTVLASLETIKPKISRVQELSRINSGNLARDLTMTRSAELGNRCDLAMADLIHALDQRLDDEKHVANNQYDVGRTLILSTGGIGLLIALVLAVVTIRSITRPVDHGISVFEALAAGDLTRRMDLNRHDEIGRLGAASDQMATSLCNVVSLIRSLAGRLCQSAEELSGVSNDMLAQSHEMATQAETVAAGTEQTSNNIASMAAAAEQMSVNVASISSASEEVSVNVGAIAASAESASSNVGAVAESIVHITTSLQAVARDARQGSQMTQQARDMAATANQAMRKLNHAANEITKVTDVIKSIALQTNLLALNATIEATSAGEAGKGFAVVAAEIKELASQSAQSAEDIARKIESVQENTSEAVRVIEDVAKFIGEINVSAGRISEVVETQTKTANRITDDVSSARMGVADIARSIAEVAKGANDVSGNTSEVAKAATDVSRNATEAAQAAETISSNIHGVSEAARESNASAVKVDATSRRLKEIAVDLERGVAHFNTGKPVQAIQHV